MLVCSFPVLRTIVPWKNLIHIHIISYSCSGCCCQKMDIEPKEFKAAGVVAKTCVPTHKRKKKTTLWCCESFGAAVPTEGQIYLFLQIRVQLCFFHLDPGGARQSTQWKIDARFHDWHYLEDYEYLVATKCQCRDMAEYDVGLFVFFIRFLNFFVISF